MGILVILWFHGIFANSSGFRGILVNFKASGVFWSFYKLRGSFFWGHFRGFERILVILKLSTTFWSFCMFKGILVILKGLGVFWSFS